MPRATEQERFYAEVNVKTAQIVRDVLHNVGSVDLLVNYWLSGPPGVSFDSEKNQFIIDPIEYIRIEN